MASEYAQIAKKNAVESRKIKKNLKKILTLPGNDCCGDCGDAITAETGWGSTSFGIVVCVQCAGIHRGVAGNQIRSFSLDTKTWAATAHIELFRKIGGNIAANKKIWEHLLSTFHVNPKYDKFGDAAHQSALRSLFINNKYESQMWTRKGTKISHKEYIKKMPIDVRQELLHFYDREQKVFHKKAEYLLIHGQYLSRYSGSRIKKNKCNDVETHDLLKLKVVINDNLHGDNVELGADEFVLMLFEDSSYIPASIARLASGISMKRINSANKIENEIVRMKLRGTFKQFVKIVHDIRATISYYRMYEQLVSIYNQDDEPLIIMNYDLQKAVFLGQGKVFGSTKCYFFAINDTLYGISGKKDPRTIYAVDDKCAHLNAKYGWHLNKIDLMLDDAGKRTGAKFALLLILKNKTIFIKFDKGTDAVQFFTLLQKEMINTKGRYLVNFSSSPPTIVGEGDAKKQSHGDDDDDDNKENNHLTIERMSSLRQQSHHKKSPTQILEIISKIQIHEEQNGPVIYESEDEDDENNKEYVYEFMQPQNSTDLMTLPPPPNIPAGVGSDTFPPRTSPKKAPQSPPKMPPPVPQMPPAAPFKPPAAPPVAPPSASYNSEIQKKLKAEQEKKQRQLKKKQREEEKKRLELEKAIAEEEKMRMKRELAEAKRKAAEEERKRKEAEEKAARLVIERQKTIEIERQKTIEIERQKRLQIEEKQRREKEEMERKMRLEAQKKLKLKQEQEKAAAAALAAQQALAAQKRQAQLQQQRAQREKELAVPSQINPAMKMANGQNVVLGSPKSWEQLEQKMMNKSNVSQARSVEEALASKYAQQNDEDSSDDSSSSDSGFSSDSDSDDSDKNKQVQPGGGAASGANNKWQQQQRGSWKAQQQQPQQQQQHLQAQAASDAAAKQRGSWQGPPNQNMSANVQQQQQRGSWQGQHHQHSYSQQQMQQMAAYNQQRMGAMPQMAAGNWAAAAAQMHQRDASQPVNMPYGAGAYGAYNAAAAMQRQKMQQHQQQLSLHKQSSNKSNSSQPAVNSDIIRQQEAELKFFRKVNPQSGAGKRWMCKMCTFENKQDATHCDMCTVARPKKASGFGNVLSPQQLKELHAKMTYHYQQYTQLQRLPPVKQQEMHKEMTYHYQQYSQMYKEYQKQQQKPKVVKKRKSKLVDNPEMQYLKLQRIFSMNDQQQLYLSNPAKFHRIQQSFGQYARITIVPQNKCYQIAIPNNIPLPRRKQHWQQIINIIRQQIGISQEI